MSNWYGHQVSASERDFYSESLREMAERQMRAMAANTKADKPKQHKQSSVAVIDAIPPLLAPPPEKTSDDIDVAELKAPWYAARAKMPKTTLVAEKAQRDKLLVPARQVVRAEFMQFCGRRIDLSPLLKQTTANDAPKWCIVDPRLPMSEKNGGSDGMRRYVGGGCEIFAGQKTKVPVRDEWGSWGAMGYTEIRALMSGTMSTPKDFPILPARARELFASDKYAKLRSRARWMGVLYKPEAWDKLQVDPAVVCEWKARPGEYYALLVWGNDRGEIMEFVD